jgi:hypothetical protein
METVLRMHLDVRHWFKHPTKDRIQRRNEGRAYALLMGNILLVLIVGICFAFKLQDGQTIYKPLCNLSGKCGISEHLLPGPSINVFWNFVVFEAASIIIYLVNGFWPEDFGGRMGDALALEGAGEDEEPAAQDGNERPIGDVERKRKGYLIPLWLTVLPNAFAIGYLAHKTGGPSYSPYAQVLVAMLLVAQQVKWVPRPAEPDKKNPFLKFGDAMMEYKLFLIVVMIFYAPLLILQSVSPANVSPARAGLSVGVTAVVFLFSTYITYLLDIGGRGESDGTDQSATDHP